MLRRPHFTLWLAAFSAFLLLGALAHAQSRPGQTSRRLITQTVDESTSVRLAGNTRPEANAANDRGPVPDSFPIEHMQIQLQLPAEKEQELEQLTRELEDPTSPNFHHWLTPDQFREDFSLAPEDIDAITGWLESHSFIVNVIYPRSIDFSGTAGQVRDAFKAEVHNLNVNGVAHFANVSDPEIPAALAPALVGVVSMNDFMPRSMSHPRVNYTIGNGEYPVVPADLATTITSIRFLRRAFPGRVRRSLWWKIPTYIAWRTGAPLFNTRPFQLHGGFFHGGSPGAAKWHRRL